MATSAEWPPSIGLQTGMQFFSSDPHPVGRASSSLVRSAIRRVLDVVRFWLGLVLFGLLSLLWSLPAGLLRHVLSRQAGAQLGQLMIMAGFRTYLGAMQALGLFHCDLRALDTLANEGALIIVANHPSLLDAVLVVSRLPRVICIAKANLWDNWFLGGGIRLAGYLRNDAPLALVRSALAELRRGQQILIFPEGTRTVAVPVARFKGGFAIMAQKSGIPVQTVLLESTSPYLTKGWPLFKRPPAPLVYRARLGARFEVTVGAEVHEFTAGLEGYFRHELGASRQAQEIA